MNTIGKFTLLSFIILAIGSCGGSKESAESTNESELKDPNVVEVVVEAEDFVDALLGRED